MAIQKVHSRGKFFEMNFLEPNLVYRLSAKLPGKKVSFMKLGPTRISALSLALLLLMVGASVSSATGGDLGVGNTSLGNIVVDGKGMTAYYYQPDVVDSGVSTCTGGCLAHWPAITSTSATPIVAGITAKVTTIAATNQIVLNGRPIYTFAGDSKPGDTNGQGIGGIWWVISPTGVELTSDEIAKEKAAAASPVATPKATQKATPKAKPKPKPKAKTKPAPKNKKKASNYSYGR